MKCPIKNKEYKELEKRVGSVVAHFLFNRFDEDYAAINDFLDSKKEIPEQELKDFEKELSESIKEEDSHLAEIKDRLNKVAKILKNRGRDSTTASAIDKLARIEEQLEDLDTMQAIQEYIKSASEIAIEYRKLMDEIIASGDLSRIDDLAFINKFLGTFDNLKDLQLTMFVEESADDKKDIKDWKKRYKQAKEEGRSKQFLEEEPRPINTTKTVDKTVKILETINKDYLEVGRNMLAQRLFAEYSEKEIETKKQLKKKLLDKNPNDAYALSIATTWQELAAQMKEASKDIDGYERWLTSTMGGSTNDFIGLISRFIDSNQMHVSDRIRYYENKLGKAHEKYAKESGINKNDVEAFNEPFLEIITETLPDGTELKTKELITEFDMQSFSQAESKFNSDNRELREKNWKLFNKKKDEWRKAHTQPKANADSIIEARRDELTEYQFEQWAKKNFYDSPSGKRTYKGELVEPGAYYRKNSKLNKLTPAQREYYNVLKEVHEELKLLLPKDKAEGIGNRIPSVYRDDWRLGMGEATLKQSAKDAVQFNESDTNYGLVGLDGKQHKEIPFYFTARMDADAASSDLLQSYLKAAKQWEMSHAKMKIMSEIQVAQDLISYDNAASDKFKVAKTTSKGENKFDPASLWKKILTKEGETEIQNKLQEVIDDMFYGIKEEATIVNLPLVGDVSLDKGTQSILKATSILGLSGAWVSGTVNAAMGNLNNLIESFAGEHIKPSNLAKGTKTYFKYSHVFIADRHKTHDKHPISEVVEDFDFMHGDYINSFGENISGNRLKKELTTSNLLVLNSAPEHQINVANGFAYMDAIKFINGKFIDRKSYMDSGGDSKIFDKSKSLLDAYEENNWKLAEPYASAWSIKQRQQVRNRVKEINKFVQGNYSASNKSALQRRWYGKLAEFFRKYVVSGFARRYGKERFNHATGTVMEGYYRSTYEFLKGVITEMKEVGIREAFSKATPQQKANMRRVVAEAVAFFIILAVVSALTPDDDEEKNTYWENVSLLLARRMQSEISFYVDPQETWRILKTPTIAMSTVGNAAEFASGLVFKWGDDEYYKRDTGIWEKGDSKDLARFTKMIPGLNGFLKGVAPEDGLKTFNR